MPGSLGITVGVLRTTSQDHGMIDPLKLSIIKMIFPVTVYKHFLKDRITHAGTDRGQRADNE